MGDLEVVLISSVIGKMIGPLLVSTLRASSRERECLSGASVSGKCSIDSNCRSGDTIVMTALAKSVNTRVTLTMGPRTHGEFEMLYCEALHGLTGQVSGSGSSDWVRKQGRYWPPR